MGEDYSVLKALVNFDTDDSTLKAKQINSIVHMVLKNNVLLKKGVLDKGMSTIEYFAKNNRIDILSALVNTKLQDGLDELIKEQEQLDKDILIYEKGSWFQKICLWIQKNILRPLSNLLNKRSFLTTVREIHERIDGENNKKDFAQVVYKFAMDNQSPKVLQIATDEFGVQFEANDIPKVTKLSFAKVVWRKSINMNDTSLRTIAKERKMKLESLQEKVTRKSKRNAAPDITTTQKHKPRINKRRNTY